MTSEEAWTGRKVNLKHLRVFGSRAYVHIPKQLRTKWDSKSKEMIFVGFCEDSKAYRLMDKNNPLGKIQKARDVVFIETKETQSNSESLEESTSDTNLEIFQQKQPNVEAERLEKSRKESLDESQEESEDEFIDAADKTFEFEDQESRYPKRERKKREFPDMILYQAISKTTMDFSGIEPSTIEEALNGENKEEWKRAMKKELNSLQENNAWKLVDLPTGKRIMENKWVFKIKRDSDGNVSRYKARLVAKGFTQKHLIDYNETFSPVVRYSTLRMFFALAAELGLQIDHMDVTTAFLNGELKEKIYMAQPKGFIAKNQENKVCLLQKAIYGLKQSSRAWYEKIDSVLIRLDFKASKLEPCVYYKIVKETIMIIILYVDDILIFSNNESNRVKLKEILMSKFKMKDLGSVKCFLGIRVEKEKNKVIIDQRKYIEEILAKFDMSECKSVGTPLEMGKKINKTESSHEKDLPYQALIGSLMYLAVCSRPDIAHAVSLLSQFNNCYTKEHWVSAKRVLRYLKGTLDYRLVYRKTGMPLSGYVDADWAGDEIDRKSYTGFAFLLGGAVFSWESKKQRTVALSSTEAEYMGLSEATKEGIFIRNILQEVLGQHNIIKLHNDNQSAQKLAKNPVFHNRSKHIDVRHHFVREAVKNRQIDLEFVPTENMIADIFTKGLCKAKHDACVLGLGLMSKNN